MENDANIEKKDLVQFLGWVYDQGIVLMKLPTGRQREERKAQKHPNPAAPNSFSEPPDAMAGRYMTFLEEKAAKEAAKAG